MLFDVVCVRMDWRICVGFVDFDEIVVGVGDGLCGVVLLVAYSIDGLEIGMNDLLLNLGGVPPCVLVILVDWIVD